MPFKIACTLSTLSLASASRSVRITGMPPPTLASNARSTRFWTAAARSSGPCLAMSSLFALTTPLTGAHRTLDERASGLFSAHHLDDQVDAIITEHDLRVGRQPLGLALRNALLVRVAHQD